jgi:hypothetical protein
MAHAFNAVILLFFSSLRNERGQSQQQGAATLPAALLRST